MKLKGPKHFFHEFECKGRPPKAKNPYGACVRVRSEGSGYTKTHYAEVVSTKTGKSIGFMGRGCNIVKTPAEAERSDYLNKMNSRDALYWCLFLRGDHKEFLKKLKVAQKERGE